VQPGSMEVAGIPGTSINTRVEECLHETSLRSQLFNLLSVIMPAPLEIIPVDKITRKEDKTKDIFKGISSEQSKTTRLVCTYINLKPLFVN